MKHLRRLLASVVLVGVFVYFVVPAMFLPSGVWRRREVRGNPLQSPIEVISIRGTTVVTANQEFQLAGVIFPTDPVESVRSHHLLRVATKQGIEVVRQVEKSGAFILRCEPRILHWCGNDPVRAHYEQLNLNELLIAFGYATFDRAATGLTNGEVLRLRSAELIAKNNKRGVWTDAPITNERSFSPELGLNISYALRLLGEIDFTAREVSADAPLLNPPRAGP